MADTGLAPAHQLAHSVLADAPVAQKGEATEWFDGASISENDREKIGQLENAIDLCNLDLGETK